VDGFVQPLAAVYPKALARDAERLLAADRRSAQALLEVAGFRRVAEHELPGLEPLRSLDTPEAYLEAVRRDEPGARATLALGERSLEVEIGTLGEVLARAAPGLGPLAGCAVRLAGCERVRDPRVPVGRERVRVIDEAGER